MSGFGLAIGLLPGLGAMVGAGLAGDVVGIWAKALAAANAPATTTAPTTVWIFFMVVLLGFVRPVVHWQCKNESTRGISTIIEQIDTHLARKIQSSGVTRIERCNFGRLSKVVTLQTWN